MVWRENAWRELTCPACHDTHLMAKRLDANPPFKPRERFALYQCGHCGTLHYPDAKVFEYESRKDADLARKFYLEVGAGLDAMLAPLAWTPLDDVSQFLEVGGGYGFSVDFASRELGWTAVNIDPSFLARTGARDLGHNHIPAYLHPDHELADNSFDLVLSSEVIEHVKDPDLFLEALDASLSPDGVLLLTTPDAAVVTPDAGLNRLLPVITAGHHLVIYSKRGLESALRRAGYNHVKVRQDGPSLTAAAAHEDFVADFDARLDRSRLQSYLAARLDELGSDPAFFAGFAVRLLKEFVHTAQWTPAEEVRRKIRQRWLRDYGLDLNSPAGLEPRFDDSEKGRRKRLRRFAAHHPFSLVIALYYAGCVHRETGNRSEAIAAFEAAARISSTLRSVFSAMYAACRETEDLGIRSRLAIADLQAEADPAAATHLLRQTLGIIGEDLEPEWRRIAFRVYASGTLTGRSGAVAAIEPIVRGHLELKAERGETMTVGQGYAAAGLASTLADRGQADAARLWYGRAIEAMSDPREKQVFADRMAALESRQSDSGKALIDAVNAGDNAAAKRLAVQLVATGGQSAIPQPVAFALGIFHLNMAADPAAATTWFGIAAEKASGDARAEARLHQAIAAERLAPDHRSQILPNLLAELQKERPIDPLLGSQIEELTARYSAQSGSKEAAN
jgi:SAM-dependent methyltransferase